MSHQLSIPQFSAQQNRIIGSTIQNVFEQGSIAKLTTNLGYDINAGFLPNEALDYSQGVIAYVLNAIKQNQAAQGCYQEDKEPVVREIVIPMIQGEISKVCKVVPPNQISYPDVRIGSLFTWLVSWAYPRQ